MFFSNNKMNAQSVFPDFWRCANEHFLSKDSSFKKISEKSRDHVRRSAGRSGASWVFTFQRNQSNLTLEVKSKIEQKNLPGVSEALTTIQKNLEKFKSQFDSNTTVEASDSRLKIVADLTHFGLVSDRERWPILLSELLSAQEKIKSGIETFLEGNKAADLNGTFKSTN